MTSDLHPGFVKVEAPFDEQQVDSLNAFQRAGVFHPFTCGNRGDGQHSYTHYGSNWDSGILVATRRGWGCVESHCPYTQSWAHSFMADWSWAGRVVRDA